MIRRLDGLLQGDYRTLFRGSGLDLADLREYQYHDDVRHIDWNVTARLQTPYVREYNEDREIDGLVPARPEPVGRLRLGRACASARCRPSSSRVLARLLTRHGNRVGAMLYGDERRHGDPARAAAGATCCTSCTRMQRAAAADRSRRDATSRELLQRALQR